MRNIAILTSILCLFGIITMYTIEINADNHAEKNDPAAVYANNWHNWRGPFANGVAINANPPTTWSESENIKWKIRIPGTGHATPIIWEDTIYIQTAILGEKPEEEENDEESESIDDNPFVGFLPNDDNRDRNNSGFPPYQFNLMAINRSNGDIIWEKTLREVAPHEGIHQDASFASNSPVTDGQHIYAYFGSRGLYCLDMNGNLKWEKDIGIMRKKNTFGEGSCPIIHEDKIVILQDHEGPSFITALDKKTGDELWKIERDERTTWTTPIIVEHAGKAQIIVPATNRSRSYDLDTGDVLWEIGGMTSNVIPSPVTTDGVVYLISGFRGAALQAVDLATASGDITDSDAVLWQYHRDTPYVPSPLLYGDVIYFLKGNDGILTAIDRNTGEKHYGPFRLRGISNVYSSIVGSDDRVYIAGRNGTVLVVQHGPSPEILAENRLDDSFNASPAIVGSELYLRGTENLYCIAEQ